MATPITWRSLSGVNQQQPQYQTRPLESANSLFQDAFGSFKDILKQREATAASNVVVGEENKKQAFLDMIQGAKTPEELAQLQQSSAFMDAQNALNPAARAATRGATEQRLALTRDQVTKGQEYDLAQRIQREAPIRDVLMGHIAGNRPEYARTVLDAYDLHGEAAIEEKLAGRIRQTTTEGHADERAGYQKNADERANSTETRAVSAERRAVAAAGNAAAESSIRRQTQQLALNEATLTADERKQVRNLRGRVDTETAKWRETAFANRSNAGAALTGFPGVQLRPDGSVSEETMSPEVYAQADAHLKQNGFQDGMRTFTHGDSAAGEAVMRNVLKGVPSHIANQVLPGLLQGVDTTGLGDIGIDAETSDRRFGETSAAIDELRNKTWYTPNSPNALTAFDTLLTEIPNLIDLSTGNSPEEDIPFIRNKLMQWARSGVPTGKGDERQVPSLQDMRLVISTAKGGWWWDDERSLDMERKLTQLMQGADSDTMRANAERIQHFDRAKAARDAAKLRKEARNPKK